MNDRGKGFILPTKRVELFGAAQTVGSPLAAAAALPTAKIRDQRATQMCTAFASAGAARVFRVARGLSSIEFSPLSLYWPARVVMQRGDEHVQDIGVDPYSLETASARFGLAPESVWPFSDEPRIVNQRPPEAALLAAQQDRIRLTTHETGSQLWDVLRREISEARRPVLLAISVDEAFRNARGRTVLGPPKGAEEGLHCIYAWGYDEKSAICAGSWGLEHGDDGNVYLSPEAIEAAHWSGSLEVIS